MHDISEVRSDLSSLLAPGPISARSFGARRTHGDSAPRAWAVAIEVVAGEAKVVQRAKARRVSG